MKEKMFRVDVEDVPEEIWAKNLEEAEKEVMNNISIMETEEEF